MGSSIPRWRDSWRELNPGIQQPQFAMKSILKKKNLKGEGSTQSSSIGAVRWPQNDQYIQAHSSAPSNVLKTTTLTQHNSLKDLRSLQECVQFINDWKTQVDQVCKGSGPPSTEDSAASESKAGIWSRAVNSSGNGPGELEHIDKLLREKPRLTRQSVTDKEEKEEKKKEKKEGGEEVNEESQLRIMHWAKELQDASEDCGVEREELGQMLRLLGLRKRRLKTMPQVWLLAKQRSWQAGVPRYIPNSVWSWICSARADVTLDPGTHHPWLHLSEDRRGVQEGRSEDANLPHGPQRFDGWPAVTAWEGYGGGRHYWEVDITGTVGHWRVGVTAADAKRRGGRFAMSPRRGYWAMWRCGTGGFYACTDPEAIPLPVALAPRRLGIHLDHDEGQLSFYNAETQTHVFTFAASFRGKVYPMFAPLDGRTPYTIEHAWSFSDEEHSMDRVIRYSVVTAVPSAVHSSVAPLRTTEVVFVVLHLAVWLPEPASWTDTAKNS
ncbi:hypothetical protein CRUP_036121 [Coryphaenoides rupestris]|nr:hypothetical protein CRUP_036121 [Coryphaenoides rupestris]